ncbi:MAG TPA: hypothetical protein VHF22_00805, partial [Planctomycetota bacterium]|nr:hypothetical protein [Planctomycetota bacterium]
QIQPDLSGARLHVGERDLAPVPIPATRTAAAEAPGLPADLAAEKWTARLGVPTATAEEVWAVVPDRDAVLVLSGLVKGGNDLHERQVASYRVSCFDAKTKSPRWTRSLAAPADTPSASFGLLGGGGPRYAGSAVEPITVADDLVIACAGGSADLVALDRKTGEERRRLEAVWEYERGFIGPSVWQHTISRFGNERYEYEKPPQEMREAARASSRILGGPVAVRRGDETRLFVAIARDNPAAVGYVAVCDVIELGAAGLRPISIVRLPRLPIGPERRVTRGGLVWACEGGAVARLEPSGSGDDEGMGMGGPFGGGDMIGRLAWYREPPLAPARAERPFLATAKVGEIAALGESAFVVQREGGFVAVEGDHVFRFPLVRIDLETGAATEIELRVPFSGEATPPSDNVSMSSGRDGVKNYRSMGPYLLAVTKLETDGRRLEVTLARGRREPPMKLAFELAE